MYPRLKGGFAEGRGTSSVEIIDYGPQMRLLKPSRTGQASHDGSLSPQPKYFAFPNAYAPPSGAAFAFPPPVEALWKQEGAKSFMSLRKSVAAMTVASRVLSQIFEKVECRLALDTLMLRAGQIAGMRSATPSFPSMLTASTERNRVNPVRAPSIWGMKPSRDLNYG